MDRSPTQSPYAESPRVKTKIIATVGPACESPERLRDLINAGVDVFRLNFAHGKHEWLSGIVRTIHEVSKETRKPIALLGDLSGPKIRLGTLPPQGILCHHDESFVFARTTDPAKPNQLTCTYEKLIDDVNEGDRILLADGTVAMRVIEKPADGQTITCSVEESGLIRSRQGINLPGVALSTPSLPEKDRGDLKWAIDNGLDFIGLSFVRSADDIQLLLEAIEAHRPAHPPLVVAKIEKPEAIDNLESILKITDAVMVARGDLGVEADITRVPILQKRIIRECNERRIPVITATQMLDSMQSNELPTRAEASDVANAVLDGTDAVMLSGETAIGKHPVKSVSTMSRICQQAEMILESHRIEDCHSEPHTHARLITEAVTLGACTAGEMLNAGLIGIATHTGRTAMAVSRRRTRVPILAITDLPETARRVCLYWGVTAALTDAVKGSSRDLLSFAVEWGIERKMLQSGSRIVLVGSTRWSAEEHDLMVVHVVP